MTKLYLDVDDPESLGRAIVEFSEYHKLRGLIVEDLDLNNIKYFSLNDAKDLAKWKGHTVYLNGLKTLTPEIALALVEWGESYLSNLYLDGLTLLSVETAQALAKWGGSTFSLNGLQTLSREAAYELSKWNGFRLSLDGLEIFSIESAHALANWRGADLSFNGLTTLTPDLAKEIIVCSTAVLEFNGLKSLTKETASVLSGWSGYGISLLGLEILSPDVAKEFAKSTGIQFVLNGLKSISYDTAYALADKSGFGQWVDDNAESCLYLDGVTSISEAALDALSDCKCQHLSLKGLPVHTLDELKVITKNPRHCLTLSRFNFLSIEFAQELSRWKGNILFLDLKYISNEAAKLLTNFNGEMIIIQGLEGISKDAATSLIKWKNAEILFNLNRENMSLENMLSRHILTSHKDERGRLHCNCGPALVMPCGFKIYAIHGNRFDPVIESSLKR